jgi:hypothetical protein
MSFSVYWARVGEGYQQGAVAVAELYSSLEETSSNAP